MPRALDLLNRGGGYCLKNRLLALVSVDLHAGSALQPPSFGKHNSIPPEKCCTIFLYFFHKFSKFYSTRMLKPSKPQAGILKGWEIQSASRTLPLSGTGIRALKPTT